MKYRACGCAKYRPLTLAAGVIAALSVSVDADLGGAEQLEQLELLAVIGTRRVAERRADAAVRSRDGRRRRVRASSIPHARRDC